MIATYEFLTTAAIAGDPAALRELLRGHDGHLRTRLAGRIRTIHRAAFDVDDVLQVTYLEAFLRIGEFRPAGEGSFAAWLERIAENNLIDAVRGMNAERRPPRSRQVTLPGSEESHGALFAHLCATSGTPSRHAARRDARTILEDALGRLPPDYELAVRLHDLEGRPAADVAHVMGRSVASVYMLKARAHARLATLIGSASRF